MEIITIPVGFLYENTYIYYDDVSKKGVIIDPGDEGRKIIASLQKLQNNNINIDAILLTHSHHDHIGACAAVKAFADVPVCAGDNEVLNAVPGIKADKTFKDGEMLSIGETGLRVIFTPGHSSDSVCYYDEKNGVLFSGDTLFYSNVGRTDLDTGNYSDMLASLVKLSKLPEKVTVYPGHGRKTTIGYETMNNPWMREAMQC